ncbi:MULTISPECIES: SDR family NAD(P)-dependent oxidoreductase [unclassified Streptomyces]|uniref:SDR family NAD(P)-dependent oxidoreductase n=1 Tax=Streptomyces sp. NBC_00060 TaxID=2975636 RepID=A0AAU2HFB8_9ACTN
MSSPTALITGASSGIGREFARQLAVRGYRLVLVARSEVKLEETAAELSDMSFSQAEILAADLGTKTGRAAVLSRLRQGDIDLLVNNAGIGYAMPASRNPVEDEMYLLEVNGLAKVELSLTALQMMLKRDRGAIINVSSIAGMAPAWLDSSYGPSKSLVLSHTEAMAYSRAVRASNVRMMALCPGDVRTEFNASAGIRDATSFGWIAPDFLVRTALADLRKGKVVSVPRRWYAFLACLIRLMPNRASKLYGYDLGKERERGAAA